MTFLFFCFALAFVFQILALAAARQLWLRLSPLLLELFPAGVALYYTIEKPSSFLFSWQDNVMLCLFIAIAIALGCGLAWLVFMIRKK